MKLFIVGRYVLRVIIIAISIGILYSLSYPWILSIRNQNSQLPISENLDNVVVGLLITETKKTNNSSIGEITAGSGPLDVSINEQALINRFDIPILAISLDYIYAPAEIVPDEYKICIEEISIVGGVTGVEDYGLFNRPQILLEDSLRQSCFENGMSYIVIDTVAFRPTILRNQNFNGYFYPFDDRVFGFEFLLKGYLEGPDGQKENIGNIDVATKLSQPIWENIIESQDIDNGDYINKKLSGTLRRPWIYRMLFFVIPIIALTALISLIAVENLGSFWEVSIAMLGLWSVHEILIPEYIDSPTIIDQTLALFYVLLLCIVFASLLAKFREKGIIDIALLIPLRRGMTNLVRWGEDQIDRGWATNEELAKAFLVRADLVNSVRTKEKLKFVAEIFINRSDTE